MHRTAPADQLRRALSLALLASTLLVTSALADPEPVKDPVPAVERGDVVVATRTIATIPQIADAPSAAHANQAFARIEYLIPARDGSDDLFVNDLRGVVYRLHRSTKDGPADVTPYLDLRNAGVGFSNVFHGNEAGLIGVAFHPDFNTPGRPGYGKLYTAFSAPPGSGKLDYPGDGDANHDSVVMEWTTNDPHASSFVGNHREVLRLGKPGDTHNIGTIAFNPTVAPGDPDYGQLYICMGDGKDQYDPLRAAQRKGDPLGKILRINPLQGPHGERHTIPPDNPFVGEPDAAPIVWACGLRHPQQFSWDLGGSHRMFIAEFGQDQVEEVNVGVKGGNYGWSQREGLYVTGMAIGAKQGPAYPTTNPDPEPYLYPVAQYDHDEGKGIASVVVYRGSLVPQLQGKLLCADVVNGRIFYADEHDLQLGRQTPLKELRLSFDGVERPLSDITNHSGGRVDLRLSIDGHGEVYLLTKGDGKIRELVPVP